ncbi:MAG: 16S rRNA (cytosine(1402)-N(4))-methyltransferase RsmH [Clostridia bacterium]|nr:16S rRNA (cytosine(1402)-N(4))-methyltransferase RsmH [Clostridia bacterium]
MEFRHVSVLLKESVDSLKIRRGGIYADGTLGGGGHSLEILKRLSGSGMLIGTDRDADAISAAKERLSGYDNIKYIHSNFSNIKAILEREGIDHLDGAVIDLGVSSYQLDCAERGFSYMADAPLDMRMNKDDALSAYDVVNTYEESRLIKIFYEYGEEKFAPRIASFIAREREGKPIETTLELSDIIKRAVPDKFKKNGSHPAKRVFQAIRIEVNGELAGLRKSLEDFFDVLSPGGRLAVITFHSLEDRIVKQTFASFAKGCTCPKDFPVCICGNKPKGTIITRKPILPSDEEMSVNKRSKSAKLRVAEKL